MPKTIRRKLYIAGFGVAAFLVLVLGTGIGIGLAYRHKFFPHVAVEDVSLAGKSPATGTAAITAAVTGYLQQKVVVAVPDIQKPLDTTGNYPLTEISTTAQNLGLVFNEKTPTTQAWQVGHTYTPAGIMVAVKDLLRSTTETLGYSVDTSKITTFIDTQLLPHIDSAQPAKIVVTNDQVTVTPQQPGVHIDQSALTRQITSALSTVLDGDVIYIKPTTSVTNATITSDTLQPVVTLLNQLGDMKVTMTGGSTVLKPNRADILSWYTPVEDDSGTVALQFAGDKVSAYITKNTGSQIDQQKSIDAAVKALTPTATAAVPAVSIALVAQVVATPTNVAAGNYTVGDYPGKYIEINLAEQKLYRINGSNLEKVYVISSGKWSTPTPVGTFTINGHSPMAFSSLYGLYMPWWMNFLDGEYGIHELPVWPNGYREGANHLGTPVSDGCVRLGIGDAEELYNWTPDGTPVIIRAN